MSKINNNFGLQPVVINDFALQHKEVAEAAQIRLQSIGTTTQQLVSDLESLIQLRRNSPPAADAWHQWALSDVLWRVAKKIADMDAAKNNEMEDREHSLAVVRGITTAALVAPKGKHFSNHARIVFKDFVAYIRLLPKSSERERSALVKGIREEAEARGFYDIVDRLPKTDSDHSPQKPEIATRGDGWRIYKRDL